VGYEYWVFGANRYNPVTDPVRLLGNNIAIIGISPPILATNPDFSEPIYQQKRIFHFFTISIRRYFFSEPISIRRYDKRTVEQHSSGGTPLQAGGTLSEGLRKSWCCGVQSVNSEI
jgi:hypothetical protein